MRKHTLTCKPQNICNEYDSFTKNSKTVDFDSSSNENEIEKESFVPAKKIIQQCVDSHIFTTKSIAENLGLLVAEFLLTILHLQQWNIIPSKT